MRGMKNDCGKRRGGRKDGRNEKEKDGQEVREDKK